MQKGYFTDDKAAKVEAPVETPEVEVTNSVMDLKKQAILAVGFLVVAGLGTSAIWRLVMR
jgi:hypothetical protein